jgi:hypothetical protein
MSSILCFALLRRSSFAALIDLRNVALERNDPHVRTHHGTLRPR